MSFFEWLQWVYAICTSGEAPANWREIAISANLAIAVAYFWIPMVMGIVFARWRSEIPFPWIWAGFIVFITACGLSHVVHAFHAIGEQTPYGSGKLAVLIATAIVSLITAAAFTFILPRIMRFAAPSATRARLEAAVRCATHDLEQALAKEKLLLREVHHRVKNNLQIISSLISLHMRRSRQDDTSELGGLRDRILAMANVHDQLQDVGAKPFSVLAFSRTLCGYLQESYGREDVDCSITGEDFEVSLDQAPAVSLILHEVISNALKHAFDDRGGELRVVLSEGEAANTIRIVDNGRGMPTSTPMGGVGGALIPALLVQLGATVEWGSPPDGGTDFTLSIPHAQALPDPVEPLERGRDREGLATRPS